MKKSSAIYCDYAAATPMAPEVIAAMQPFWTENFYNPSAIYLAGKEAATVLQSARERVAHWLGVRPSEIVFTAGGSEANNLAIHGVMRQFPDANCVVSAVEHDSVLKAAERYACKLAPVGDDGRVNTQEIARLIEDNTVLVSVMFANNELGTLQPVREIAKNLQFVREQRRKSGNKTPLYLHTDACQAAQYFDLQVGKLGVDLLTINGSKLYGPKQVGALYVRAGISLTPLIDGGGQEFGLRSGTENVSGAIGLATALELAQLQRSDETVRQKQLQQHFEQELTAGIPAIVINGGKHRLPNITHITLEGIDNERVMMELDERGVQCAVGSACSASSDEPSHVLTAIGLNDSQARASLRFSFGRQTTEADVQTVAHTLASVLAKR
jgi:cysteine desulfurase